MFDSYYEELQKRPTMWVEREQHTQSSTSGASSSDFHKYRRFKRQEA